MNLTTRRQANKNSCIPLWVCAFWQICLALGFPRLFVIKGQFFLFLLLLSMSSRLLFMPPSPPLPELQQCPCWPRFLTFSYSSSLALLCPFIMTHVPHSLCWQLQGTTADEQETISKWITTPSNMNYRMAQQQQQEEEEKTAQHGSRRKKSLSWLNEHGVCCYYFPACLASLSSSPFCLSCKHTWAFVSGKQIKCFTLVSRRLPYINVNNSPSFFVHENFHAILYMRSYFAMKSAQ